jgi:glycine cleavage system transcriptional repressor
MSQLGGEFAVIVLVTGSDQALTEIDNSLRQMEGALGVSCFAKRTSKSVAKEEGRVYSFQASGFDRPGIVEAVTSVLAARHINVTSFSSHLENAPLSGTEMFFLDAIVRLPPSGDFEDLMIGLTEACQREDLEFTLSEV